MGELSAPRRKAPPLRGVWHAPLRGPKKRSSIAPSVLSLRDLSRATRTRMWTWARNDLVTVLRSLCVHRPALRWAARCHGRACILNPRPQRSISTTHDHSRGAGTAYATQQAVTHRVKRRRASRSRHGGTLSREKSTAPKGDRYEKSRFDCSRARGHLPVERLRDERDPGLGASTEVRT